MNLPREPGLTDDGELQACLALAAPVGGASSLEAVDAAQRAISLALRLHRTPELAQAVIARCTHLLRLGRYPELLQEAQQHLPALAATALPAQHRELLRLVTLAGSEAGQFDTALAAAHELVRRSAGDSDEGAALTATLALAICVERMGDSWQAVRLLEQSLRDHGAAAGAPGAPDTSLLPLLMTSNGLCATALGIMHRLLDLDAGTELQEVLQLARRAGEQSLQTLQRLVHPAYLVAVRGNLGEVMLYQGEALAAEPLLRGALRDAQALGLRAHGWRVQVTLGAWMLAQGDAPGALAAMTALIAEMGSEAPPQTLVRARHAAYRACRALGRFEEALQHFERAERTERSRTMAQLRAQSQLFVTRSEAQHAQWQAEQARGEAQQQRERAAEAVAHAERDPLTGLGNRRHLQARCAELLPLAQRHGRPLALAVMDLDRFKQVNDQHGHAAGDQVLVTVAQLLRENMRNDDVLVRHGGEEFVIVLPGQSLEAAAEVCERLRQRLASLDWPAACGVPALITASIGLAAAPAYELAQLLQRADEALYEAKRSGRNRVLRAR